MGASASHPTEDGVVPPIHALHVLRVSPGSPASQTDIEPFFDFVVSVDQGLLGENDKGINVHNLERIVESREGKPLPLVVWSSKTETYRQVTIVPSRLWSIPASNSPRSTHSRLPSVAHSSHSRSNSLDDIRKPSLLGLSMRVCEPAIALDNVWHILEVLEGSPAESAGLVPFGDWIVGWSGGVLKGENDFLDVVEAHVEKPLRVYVYSYDFDTLREVVLVPNRMWGGEGLLGCGVGFGLLHRIPKVREEEYAPEDDFQSVHHEQNGFDRGNYDDMQEHELFVPADDIIYDDEPVPEPRLDSVSLVQHETSVVPTPASTDSGHRIITNPFLPEHRSENPPHNHSEPSPSLSPEDDLTPEERAETPSPATTPTPSSPSFHGSEFTPEPSLTPMNNITFQPQPRRPSAPLNSFRTFSASAGWGGAANRFVGTPPRRATPTQFSPQIRPRGTQDDNDDISDEDETDERGLRRSPSGSMTSVDD